MMCQYWVLNPSPESTWTFRPPSNETVPERTAYTAVPSGTEMSTPKWKENEPRPFRRVAGVGGPSNVVRGSPKFARTGCGRPKGLTGQRYADAVGTVPAAAEGVP